MGAIFVSRTNRTYVWARPPAAVGTGLLPGPCRRCLKSTGRPQAPEMEWCATGRGKSAGAAPAAKRGSDPRHRRTARAGDPAPAEPDHGWPRWPNFRPLTLAGAQRDAGSQRGPLPQRSEEATPGVRPRKTGAAQPQRSRPLSPARDPCEAWRRARSP